MFNLIARNLTGIGLSVFKTTSIHRLSPRPLSSSPAALAPNLVKCSSVENSFAVSYLVDSCGFPPEKAISASKYLKFKTPDRADSVIIFLKNQGFTETQAFELVRRFPNVLSLCPQKNLLPKFEFFSSVGLSGSDIVKLLIGRPKALGASLKNRIQPTFSLLRDLLQSNDRALIAMKRCAWVWNAAFQPHMLPNMQLLRDVGVPGLKVLYLLTRQPSDFLVSTDQFKKVVEEVIDMGFDPLKINFMLAVHALRSMTKPTWDKKMETYKKWGWSKDEIVVAFKTYPWCMMTSEEKINKVMDFLVNEMGFDTHTIAKNSVILSLSLEKRIVPRCLVYRYLSDNEFMKKKKHVGLSWWLICSEIKFINRLKIYETQIPGALEFYQEKLNHAN